MADGKSVGFELKKFFLLAVMMMCILFNYNAMRGAKDMLVVTNMGAEVIPVLKLCFVLPAIVLSLLVYAKLSNMFSKSTVFYIVTSFFIAYIALFACVLFPFREALTPNWNLEGYDHLMKSLLIPIRGWVYSSFYIMAELWGITMISLVFWCFANEVTAIAQSKRFHAMVGFVIIFEFVASGASIISRGVLKVVKEVSHVNLITVVIGLAIIGIYHWLNNCVLTDQRVLNRETEEKD